MCVFCTLLRICFLLLLKIIYKKMLILLFVLHVHNMSAPWELNNREFG